MQRHETARTMTHASSTKKLKKYVYLCLVKGWGGHSLKLPWQREPVFDNLPPELR